MKYALLAVGLIAMLAGLRAYAAGAEARRSRADLDAEINAIVHDSLQPLASASVLAIRDGRVVYEYQAGLRFIDEHNPAASKPANARTLYRVASISKLVTSLGVMKLVEEGRLDLDADVGDYLGYALRNPHFPAQPITLRRLMSHTSSLRDDAGYNVDYRIDLRELLVPGGAHYGNGAAWARDHGPGYFSYVNLNWGVIGTIMERVTGERFDLLMQRLLLAPMGLRGGFNAAAFPAKDLDDLATLYRKRIERDGREIWRPQGPWVAQIDDYSRAPPAARAGADYVPGTNGTVFGPQGGLRISAADLGKIMLMLMDGGRHEGRRILQPASLATLFAEQWRNDGRDGNGSNHRGIFNAWGLGLQHFRNVSGVGTGDRLVRDGGFSGLGHTGDAWGLTSAFVFDPVRRQGLIFMIGGPGFDPQTTPGAYSGRYRYEERLLDSLYRALSP